MKNTGAYVALGLVIGLTTNAVFALAWSGPTSAPPGANVSAPMNVGTTTQIKNGDVGVNNFTGFGNALLSGLGIGTGRYLNFDFTTGGTSGTGSSGYGIRDNAGTLEFKNIGGTWASLQATISALCGSGSCAGGASGAGFSTTVFEDTQSGGVSKNYTCPSGQYVLSSQTYQIPGGALVCGTSVSADKTTVSYGGCGVVSGQSYFTRVICGGGSGSGGSGAMSLGGMYSWSNSHVGDVVNPLTGALSCPAGYASKTLMVWNGQNATSGSNDQFWIAYCWAAGGGSGAAPSGTLCGRGNYNIYNGWSNPSILCQGYDPRTSCPSGYAQKLIISNGGVDTQYYCVAN